MLHLSYVSWAFLALLWTVVQSDDALKNHRAEKRQDDSFLFFGGWRPVRQVKSGSRYLQTAASSRYHDILSALPHSFDATANYYAHALPAPSRYNKDIYSYYPRPAIKSTPKKNTPVYMERAKPQPQQQQKHSGRGVSNPAPQFLDLQSIDLKQLQDLHDIILQTKHLPLTNLNLPFESGKPLEIVEVSLQSLQQGNQNYGSRNSNRHQRNRNSQSNKGHKRGQQSRQPVQYEYVAFPKTNLPQVLPREIELGPIKLPHVVPSIQEVVDLKNVQIVEVPIPSGPIYGLPRNQGRGSSHYGSSGTRSSSNQKYNSAPPTTQQSFPYYAQQIEQPRKQYSSTQLSGNHIQLQPNIEAELIKLDDDTLKNLLSNLQVLEKSPHELLKYLPITNIGNGKDDNVQLILSLPGANQGSNSHGQNYEVQQTNSQAGSYGNEEQYAAREPQYGGQAQHISYESKGSGNLRANSGGYHKEVQNSYQSVEHNSAGYESENHAPSGNGGQYETNNYQSVEVQSGYDQQKKYQEENQANPQNHYQVDQQQYSQQTNDNHEGTREQQGGSYNQREQTYIQVLSPQDENGYRREPVLALEIAHGQSIEDALKSLDPETLQKIGAHSKDGIEIEVVEVPVDEYASESKKTETVVSAKNSTVPVKTKKRVKLLSS